MTEQITVSVAPKVAECTVRLRTVNAASWTYW